MNKTAVATVVEEIYHAKYGASGYGGWGNCSAWVGGGVATVYAATGSVIHSVSETCLTSPSRPIDFIGQTFESDRFKILFNEDHATIAASYVDKVKDLHATLGGDLLVEQTFDLEYLTGEPGAKSTLDCAIVPKVRGELLVGDLKTGAGVPVDAKDNGQLVIYAILAYDEYSVVSEITSVRMMIFQPPLNNFSEWTISIEELEQWRERIKAAAAAAQAPDPSPTPGEKQCRWCSKAATCSSLSGEVFEAVEDSDPSDIATDDLAVAMAKADMIEAWLKAIRAETERRLLDGRAVKGFKLVAGKRGARKWTSEADAEAMLKSMRLKHDQIYDYSVVSPTSAEKLFKAGALGERQWPKLQSLITQTEGKPSVAPEDDKRPALVISADEFQPVEAEVPG